MSASAAPSSSLVAIALRCAGPLLFMGLQLSQLRTALSILSARSVGQLSSAPFLSLLVNCIVWGLYGTITKDMTILVPNGSGMIIGAVCCLIFHRHQPIPSSSTTIGLIAVLIAIYCYMAGDIRSIGVLGCIISIVLSASPLAVIRIVLKTKSTSSLPFSVIRKCINCAVLDRCRAVLLCG